LSDKFRAILDALPEKPPRSRLEPYSDLIDELRRRRRTYREIVSVLAEKCNLRVSISTIHDFVRAKSKEARKAAKLLRTAVPSADIHNPDSTPPRRSAPQLNQGNPTAEEVQRRIAALKQRKVPPATNPSEGFQYNPDEPLRLLTPGKQVSK
jgi:IS30 family transposase